MRMATQKEGAINEGRDELLEYTGKGCLSNRNLRLCVDINLVLVVY